MLGGSTAACADDSDITSLKPPSTGNRNSYGHWTGSKSAASTPNLGGSAHHSHHHHQTATRTSNELYIDNDGLHIPHSNTSFSLTSLASTGVAVTTAEGDILRHHSHCNNNSGSSSSRGALSLAQFQAQSMGSMASMDSGSSASFHKHRKRSESTGGGFKVTYKLSRHSRS